MSLRINHQSLRHTAIARRFRSGLVRLLVGGGNWPLVLNAPNPAEPMPVARSSHLYVHLPFCDQICPHCPYNKTLYDAHAHRAYGTALRAELSEYLQLSDVPAIESIYFGGGTPSRTPGLVEDVLKQVNGHLVTNAHVGIEVHPQDASEELYQRLHAAGINRISLGVESFSPKVLRPLGRRYTPEQAVEAISLAREEGFSCVDANLIFGVPGQTVEDAVADVERCLSLDIDQISTYPLLSFVHTPLGRRIARGRVSPYGERARIGAQKAISRVCREGGLKRTSMWSFSRPNVPAYTTVTHEEYAGFGAGAASKVDNTFLLNTFSIEAYIEDPTRKPALVMEASEALRRFHWLYWQIYRVRISPARYLELFDRSLDEDFGRLLNLLRMLGWADREKDLWRITEAGAIWLHRLRWFYSLHHVDTIWKQCQSEAWPDRVVLA